MIYDFAISPTIRPKRRRGPRWYVEANTYTRAQALFGPFYSKAEAVRYCTRNNRFYRIVREVRFRIVTHTEATRVFEDELPQLVRAPIFPVGARDLGLQYKEKV